MVRNAESLKIDKWSGDSPTNREEVPAALVQTGWHIGYSQVGGTPGPERLYFNQLVFQLTALFAEMNQTGIPVWSEDVNYLHTAFVVGSDGNIHVSRADSGPATFDSEDPTMTGTTKWRQY